MFYQDLRDVSFCNRRYVPALRLKFSKIVPSARGCDQGIVVKLRQRLKIFVSLNRPT